MPRINVTGNAGAGKSTLSARIALVLGLPLYHLDEVTFKPGWRKVERDERIAKQRTLCAQPHWVIDGLSHTVRESADIIVFLDVPRRVSYWRCAKRNWRYLFRSRPGLPPNCPEIRRTRRLARFIWRFPKRTRPMLLAELENWREQKMIVLLRSDEEVDAFLRRLQQAAESDGVLPYSSVASSVDVGCGNKKGDRSRCPSVFVFSLTKGFRGVGSLFRISEDHVFSGFGYDVQAFRVPIGTHDLTHAIVCESKASVSASRRTAALHVSR